MSYYKLQFVIGTYEYCGNTIAYRGTSSKLLQRSVCMIEITKQDYRCLDKWLHILLLNISK